MTVRFLPSRRSSHSRQTTVFSALLGVGAIVLGSACKDDAVTVDAQIRSFCDRLFASSAFACCSAQDRSNPLFAARSKYGNAESCSQVLNAQYTSGAGRQTFDADASNSCLEHLGSRACGVVPTLTVKAAEEAAGCNRVLAGTQEEGQPCAGQSDCRVGLFCPPTKETGASVCSKPAAVNEICSAEQANSVDHPACQKNLFCVFAADIPVCPAPPCQEFRCVPPGEGPEKDTSGAIIKPGDPCSGVECKTGLTCRNGTCSAEGLAPAGQACTISEQCVAGLYCDPAKKACAERKADGAPCQIGNNSVFECKGICEGTGDTGVCAAFCSSG